MGSFSIWHWLIVLAVVLVLFGGGGKLSRLMGDFGKGLKSFKKNVKDETSSSEEDEESKRLEGSAASPSHDAKPDASPAEEKKTAANR